ncbi:hypothetical protein AYI69_g5433 [Smittium culicis]|uniref:Uncharacterized protein n=1 Tax=Smittium culicis TaxID=133412 RepID=A0A1R1Y5Z7_9FUNG|nr:hypothetical protein AYI69_g5433 [Smittium culicis]
MWSVSRMPGITNPLRILHQRHLKGRYRPGSSRDSQHNTRSSVCNRCIVAVRLHRKHEKSIGIHRIVAGLQQNGIRCLQVCDHCFQLRLSGRTHTVAADYLHHEPLHIIGLFLE